MTNEHEKQWQELIERSAHVYSLEFKEIGEYENIKDVYLDASDFVRANLSYLPEYREIIKELKLAMAQCGIPDEVEAAYKTMVTLRNLVKNLEGGK